MKVGRKKPYTNEEIAELPCVGCGQPAVHQWNCCANENRWMAICLNCDVALNEIFLAFIRMPGRHKTLKRYRDQQKK